MREIKDTTAIVLQTATEIRQAYGKKPLLLGLITSDPFKLNLGYTVGGFLLLASGLWTFVLALAYFWANDAGANAQEFRGETVEIDATPIEDETPPPNPFPAFQPQNAPAPSPAATDLIVTVPTPSPAIVKPTTASNQGSQASIVSIPNAPSAYSVLVGNPFLSRAGFGAQRSGKSYLLAIATQELALERGVQIFHINLASYGDEDSRYWGHAVQSVRCDLPSLDSYQAEHFVNQAIECVHTFFSVRNSILIFDEITLTGAINNQHSEIVAPLLKLVADKIACLASTGIKRAQAVWSASPDFVAGACTQDCKALKSLSICYVAIAPGKSVDWNGNPVKFHQESFENIKRNFPSLTYPEGKWKGDRICFVDGQWRELGELPVLREATPNSHPVVAKTAEIAQQLEAIYERSESLPSNPISDWDNGYQATDDALLEVLEFIRGKYGTEPINPSEVHRSQTSVRKFYDGKVDNLKALLLRAIQEELAVLESDDKGNPVIRIL